jgi:hypothetical protein
MSRTQQGLRFDAEPHIADFHNVESRKSNTLSTVALIAEKIFLPTLFFIVLTARSRRKEPTAAVGLG